MEEVAIKVEHVKKDFLLPHDKVNSVKGIVTSLAKGRAWRTKETQHALRGVSFEVKKGEFFGVVGRNGSGKSTMLKMLAGIYQPTKGHITTIGKLVPFIELGVGFNPELTGRENVYLNGAMMGFSQKQVDDMYDEIVAFAELEQFMDQKLKNYSSGMQVRLAFSVAVKAEADTLLVDEVLAVGDADFQGKCFDYFRELKARGTTVILVTHDMGAVRQYCDRALLIENGKVLARGTAAEVASAYSRMFIEDKQEEGEKSKDAKRWGDGAMTYQKMVVPNNLHEDEPLKLTAIAEVRRDIDSPVFGFAIKSADRRPLLGTNTMRLHQVFGLLSAGTKVKIEWSIPNIFSHGTHYVDFAVVYKGGATIADWAEEVAMFTVLKQEKSNFPADPPVEVVVEKF